jgi:hypothetical protein
VRGPRRPPTVLGDVVIIHLTRGKQAVVDAIDGDLAQFNWIAKASSGGAFYAGRAGETSSSKNICLHLVIAARCGAIVDGMFVDHADHDSLNCRRLNLRPATHQQNQCNRGAPRHNTSGFKGVSQDKRTLKWRAYIRVNGVRKHLGVFTRADAAAAAYGIAARELHGPFANVGIGAVLARGGELGQAGAP